jgi:hypothetical protein
MDVLESTLLGACDIQPAIKSILQYRNNISIVQEKSELFLLFRMIIN